MSLTDAQLKELRTQLKSERRRILGNIEALQAEFGATISEDTDEHGLESHLADQGTMTFLRERDLSIEEHEEQLLTEIDAALDRIKDGSYGVCEVDGTPIDFDRLQALPWARTHIEHATS
ncbi:MAG: conjugal transfer protein TraR [Thermoleophilia bacterium]|nr:conjugal transfer protein TraR [Thermoleophilia bacterium]